MNHNYKHRGVDLIDLLDSKEFGFASVNPNQNTTWMLPLKWPDIVVKNEDQFPGTAF